MSKELLELEKIVKTLEKDATFMEKYDVNLKEISRATFVRIKRKEKTGTLEDKTVYNPYVSMEYDEQPNYCFEIHCDAGYLFNVFTVMVVKYVAEYDGGSWFGLVSPPMPNHVQTITVGEVNVPAIMKYVVNSEFNLITRRAHTATYVASNAHLCEKCRCEIHTRQWGV